MTEQKHDFGTGSVERNIINMAVPMTVAQVLNLLYNLVDRMYIGHIPGASSLALTGVGITFPVISMITRKPGGSCRMRSGCWSLPESY